MLLSLIAGLAPVLFRSGAGPPGYLEKDRKSVSYIHLVILSEAKNLK